MGSAPAPADKPYGYVVKYEYRENNGTMAGGDIKTAIFRRKGSKCAARRAALFKRGYLRVVSVDPYTHEQWIRCFGEGRM